MIPNRSPWIQQLKRTRPVKSLDRDLRADVAIVGGGIAGVTTAFFALRETDKRVVLLEADKVAHGATGHNAGQVTSYFERPLHELAERFGLEAAVRAQRDIESAWELIDGIIRQAGLRTPLHAFIGHAGFSTLDQLTEHLKNNRCRQRGGLELERILVAREWEGRAAIPEEFNDLFDVVPHGAILARLETRNPQYVASLSYRKGCMNSALFAEEVVGYLLATYPERFSLHEGTPVGTVRLSRTGAALEAHGYAVRSEKVVLCTNGFEHFSIVNEAGRDIDTSFHHAVTGRIGYMAGYFAPPGDSPMAISYFPKREGISLDPVGESYFYLTRRPHEHESGTSHTLVCTGGPEAMLPNGAEYVRAAACAEEPRIAIDDFLSSNYEKHPGAEPEYAFCWHGLMGYTPEGVRLIGPEPINPVLLYNLGCNGVGILPSVFGGRRIAGFLKGETLEPSIFDPRLDGRVRAGRFDGLLNAASTALAALFALASYVPYGYVATSLSFELLGTIHFGIAGSVAAFFMAMVSGRREKPYRVLSLIGALNLAVVGWYLGCSLIINRFPQNPGALDAANMLGGAGLFAVWYLQGSLAFLKRRSSKTRA